MESGARSGRGRVLRSHGTHVFVGLAVVAVIVAVVATRLPEPVEGAGTLDQCFWGWPVVRIDGGTDPYLPVASWPVGLTFDEADGVLRDPTGQVVLNRGDRIVVTGSVIEVHGDPSPCFYTRGIKVQSVGPE